MVDLVLLVLHCLPYGWISLKPLSGNVFWCCSACLPNGPTTSLHPLHPHSPGWMWGRFFGPRTDQACFRHFWVCRLAYTSKYIFCFYYVLFKHTYIYIYTYMVMCEVYSTCFMAWLDPNDWVCVDIPPSEWAVKVGLCRWGIAHLRGSYRCYMLPMYKWFQYVTGVFQVSPMPTNSYHGFV